MSFGKFLTVLGVLLLKLAMNPQVGNMEDYLLSIILNLCIGLSMLFIPIATRSLINDGLESAASALASASAMTAATTAKLYVTRVMKQGAAKTWGAGKFAVKLLLIQLVDRITRFREKIEPKLANSRRNTQILIHWSGRQKRIQKKFIEYMDLLIGIQTKQMEKKNE